MLMMNQFQEPAMFAPLQHTQAFLLGPSVHIHPSSTASSWSTEISETTMVPKHRKAVFRAGVARRWSSLHSAVSTSFLTFLTLLKTLGFFFHSFRLKFIFFKSKRRMHGNSSPTLPEYVRMCFLYIQKKNPNKLRIQMEQKRV